eukprot:2585950-Prymnesium_polylepis.1
MIRSCVGDGLHPCLRPRPWPVRVYLPLCAITDDHSVNGHHARLASASAHCARARWAGDGG